MMRVRGKARESDRRGRTGMRSSWLIAGLTLLAWTLVSPAVPPSLRAATEQQELTATNGTQDMFGESLAINADTVVIGAPIKGAAYVFRFTGGTWVQQQELTGVGGEATAIDADMIVIGAPGEGSAHAFQFDGTAWVEQKPKLTPSDGAALDRFGTSVAIDGDTALIGAEGDDDNGDESGSAYIFHFNGVAWIEQPKLTASDGAADDGFGFSVALSGDTALIGTPFGDSPETPDTGSAYVFSSIVTPPTDDGKKATFRSTLGNNGKRSLDWDKFVFEGTQGEEVKITLEDPLEGQLEGHRGKRATLILEDRIHRVRLFKINRSALPNTISVKLPATGKYRIIVAEQPSRFKRFVRDERRR